MKEPGTATNPEDYPTEVVEVYFPPDVDFRNAQIQVTNDREVETYEEIFFVNLITNVQGTLDDIIRRSEITIIDDDSKYNFPCNID